MVRQNLQFYFQNESDSWDLVNRGEGSSFATEAFKQVEWPQQAFGDQRYGWSLSCSVKKNSITNGGILQTVVKRAEAFQMQQSWVDRPR